MNVEMACLWEATARKLGNVHPGASFADMEYFDFVKSALALQEAWNKVSSTSPPEGEVVPTKSGREGGAFDFVHHSPPHPPFSLRSTVDLPLRGGGEEAATLGERIFQGVAATQTAVGKNTNLGIVLLLAPLLDRRESRLNETTVEDARQLYAAIRHAAPGGMGTSKEQDVAAEPTVTLLEAMELAADRDMIARQYSNGFADILDFGVPAFLNGIERFGCIEAAIVHCQLRWLAEFPDSLIARKNGVEVAEDVRQRAAAVFELGIHTTEGRAAGVALDRHLRSNGHALNLGTTADLVTACLFVALREGKVDTTLPFRWNVPDWL